MKLPFFNLKKKEVKNHFLALLLQDEKIGAVVLEESHGTIHVVGHAEERFQTSLEEAGFDEWLEVVDHAVSTAEENLPGKIQTEKTVFGVKQDWLDEGRIKKGYLARLKKICEELSLQPIGFLVFTEAILHLLQKEEGAPVSSILVELGKKFIIISVVRAGRIIETNLIPFEEPVAVTVDTALKEFSVEILPSRIILFNSEENKPLTQEFIGHSWSKSLPFLHMPQVTVLPATFDTKSVLFGTAAQLGFAVVGADTLPTKTRSVSIAKPIPQEIPDLSIENPSEESEEDVPQDNTDEEDTAPKPPHPQEEQTLSDTVSADYFGFLKEADVASTPLKGKKQKHAPTSEEETNVESIEEIPEQVKEEETNEFEAANFSSSASALFTGIKNGIQPLLKQKSLKNILRLFSLGIEKARKLFPKGTSFPTHARKERSSFPIIWIAAPAGVVICLGLLLFYIFGISAKVTLTVTPKVLTNQQSVTFVTDGTSNFDTGVLLGQTVTTDEKGSASEQATGTKQVGTAAKGAVTIYNVSDTASLSAGTTLVAANGKKFTLDSAVNVPAGDPTSAGTATVNVTSSDIGPDYNMPSGTKFTLSSDTLGAKNDTAFSGGTKKDVIVVSQTDIDKLTQDVTKNLEDKAKSDLAGQVGGDKTLLPFFTSEAISQKTFSKKAGDEAQSVSLDATVTYTGIAIDKTDLENYANHVLQGDISSDMTLTADGIQTNLADIKQSKDSVSGTLNMTASLLPKVDTAQLAKTIAGKSFDQAGSAIKALPQIQNIDFLLSPNLPFLPRILPRLANHITVTLVSHE